MGEDRGITVCIITKNEEHKIRECVIGFAKQHFPVIVMDTGSLDATPHIAKEAGAEVTHFLWCDDFAKAKNACIEQAKTPYVMVIDSDEVVASIDKNALERCIKEHPNDVGRIRRINQGTSGQQDTYEWINRIFLKEDYHYEGKIHEQLVGKKKAEYNTYCAPITIYHTGYSGTQEERTKKAKRNQRLLESELKEKGEDPYLLYQIGKSQSMAGEYAQACQSYEKALSFDLNPKLEYVIDAVNAYGYALINSGQQEKALSFESIYETFGKNPDFTFLMGLIYMKNADFEGALREFQVTTLLNGGTVGGITTYLPNYNTGVVLECLGRLEEAKKYYKDCGSYQPAIKRLNSIKRGEK